ncbi:MAG TPA: hypothetical protein VND64_11385 [Pirellulales bacterium]|nr:hypothetical protein [Pirellulales bacterium]
MRNQRRLVVCLVTLAGGAAVHHAAPVTAQGDRAARHHVSLPPQYGATVASTVIFAQASYIAATGDFLESVAIARRDHAAAAEREIHNARLWVSTYFEIKEMNRAYRLKMNPPILEKLETRQKQIDRRIRDNTDLVLRGDPTDELNKMLRELAGVTTAYQLLDGAQSLADSAIDQKLAPGDAHHVRLTDGGRQGGKTLIFRADAADVQETHWPRALRRHEFDEAREGFERERDSVVRHLGQKGDLSPEAEERLMAATDRLCDAFNVAFPRKGKGLSPHDFYNVYLPGKQFLVSLAGQVDRLIESNDARVFDGSYRFEGDSVVDLVNHLARYGLQFAPPEPGGEGTYRKLFFAVRNVYMNVVPEGSRRSGR